MQDKITIADAPECLNTNDKAMWVLGYQAALEARSTCLHQIQEPAAAEQAAWHAGLDEGRAQATGYISNTTFQAAPAAVAVAVADEREAFEKWAYENAIRADMGAWEAWKGRAALSATPAQSMVLPEPVAWLANYEDREGNSKYYTSTHKDLAQENDTNGEPQSLFTEQQVRALLATATGLPAQAEDIADLVTGMSVSVDVSTGDDDAGNRYFGTVTLAQEDNEGKHGLTLLVQDAEPNFTPQAQADAREVLTPAKPVHPKGMTSINARLSFNLGWMECERHHGIRSEDVEQAVAIDAAIAAAKGEAQ